MKVCSKTPEVPFGSTFLPHTQFIVINLGKENVRVIFSMEAEFPNGAPMVSLANVHRDFLFIDFIISQVARQIKSALRTGATEFATLFSEYVFAYANVYP